MKCPSCGSENNDSAKFCKNCGENLQVSSSQDTSTQNTSAQITPSSEPKSNKNLLIICATVIICVIVIAGAFLALNSSNSGISSNANSAMGIDNAESSSSGYYQYDFCGYTFNIPEDYEEFSVDEYSTGISGAEQIGFKKDDDHFMFIAVLEDASGLSEELLDKTYNDKTLEGGAHFTSQEIDGKKVYRFTNSTTDCVFFGSGKDLISVLTYNEDLEPIISSIDQKEIPKSSSSSGSTTKTETMSYSEAASYLSGASSTVVENTFDEADANGDGVLTGSEISKFKKLADLTERTADTSNTENVEAQDYAGTGDGTTKTRYCTTHGRVAVGDDNLCPYCLEEGLDARTVKDSTEYI